MQRHYNAHLNVALYGGRAIMYLAQGHKKNMNRLRSFRGEKILRLIQADVTMRSSKSVDFMRIMPNGVDNPVDLAIVALQAFNSSRLSRIYIYIYTCTFSCTHSSATQES